MNIKPIRNTVDHQAALVRVEKLMEAKPDTPQGDELDVLVTLIEAYEDKTYPIFAPNPVDAIRFQMEQYGYTQTDLSNLFGSRSRSSEILKARRPLTLSMIRKLVRDWDIPAESLIGEPAHP